MTRQPTPDEVRLQAAQIIALARDLDLPVTRLADALTTCGMRLQRDQLAVPATVSALLVPAPVTYNGHKRGKK